MTPLAHRILKDSLLPPAKRSFADRCGLLAEMEGAHYFDVSEVMEAANDLGEELHRSLVGPDGRYISGAVKTKDLAFLPAPKTWLEWVADNGERRACLLTDLHGSATEAQEPDALALVDWVFADPFCSSMAPGSHDESAAADDMQGGVLELRAGMEGGIKGAAIPNRPVGESLSACLMIWALLALINSPRIIGRRQHMPHAGLQKALARSRGMVGKFPLRGWTEIKLEIAPPATDEGEPHEARLTGQKALHFCRAHLRIRNGKLERVRAHWRGDPALGIKRSRYRLTNVAA